MKRLKKIPDLFTFGDSKAAVNLMKIAEEAIQNGDTEAQGQLKKAFRILSEWKRVCKQLAFIPAKMVRNRASWSYQREFLFPRIEAIEQAGFKKIRTHCGTVVKTFHRELIDNLNQPTND